MLMLLLLLLMLMLLLMLQLLDANAAIATANAAVGSAGTGDFFLRSISEWNDSLKSSYLACVWMRLAEKHMGSLEWC